jgi:hypothetical protein
MLRGRGHWSGRLGGAALWWAITSALGHLTSTVAGFFGYGRMATLELFGPWTFYAREFGVQVWDTATVAVAILLVAQGLRSAMASEASPRTQVLSRPGDVTAPAARRSGRVGQVDGAGGGDLAGVAADDLERGAVAAVVGRDADVDQEQLPAAAGGDPAGSLRGVADDHPAHADRGERGVERRARDRFILQGEATEP